MRLDESIKRLSESLGLNANESDEEIDLARLQESSSESGLSSGLSSGDSEESEESDSIAASDVDENDEDVVLHQKMTINNVSALKKALHSIRLPSSAYAKFEEHFSVIGEPIDVKDVHDDTERELCFYKQALAAAQTARKHAKQAAVPFDRPVDYFAEMVKSDEHMDRLRKKLVDEEKEKLGVQEARKQRELRKYGKKVQHEKLQQRQKEKRAMLDKVNSLRRKDGRGAGDDFDVQLEDALTDKKAARNEQYKLSASRQPPNRKRLAKNARFGSGHKRNERKNTAESSMDLGYKSKRRR